MPSRRRKSLTFNRGRERINNRGMKNSPACEAIKCPFKPQIGIHKSPIFFGPTTRIMMVVHRPSESRCAPGTMCVQPIRSQQASRMPHLLPLSDQKNCALVVVVTLLEKPPSKPQRHWPARKALVVICSTSLKQWQALRS